MLVNFFTSIGSLNPAADAGLALNLKSQGESDANIENAIASQDATLQSIQNAQQQQAAQALAAEQPVIAAAKATMTAATAEHATSPANQSPNAIITVNGVQETRAQAASFADNQSGVMVFDPNNPTGPKITIQQYNMELAKNALAETSNGIALAPNVSKLGQATVNGVIVAPPADQSNPSKTTTTQAIGQPSPNPVLDQVTSIVNNAISGAKAVGADIQGAVTTALNNAGLAATNEANSVLKSLGLLPPTPAQAPTPSKPSMKITPATTPPTPPTEAPVQPSVDPLTALYNFLTGTKPTPTEAPVASSVTSAASTEAAAIQSGISSGISTVEQDLSGFLAKILPPTQALTPSQGATTTTETTPATTPPTPAPASSPTGATPAGQPPVIQPTTPPTLLQKIQNRIVALGLSGNVKYLVAGLLAVGGLGTIILVTSRQNKKQVVIS